MTAEPPPQHVLEAVDEAAVAAHATMETREPGRRRPRPEAAAASPAAVAAASAAAAAVTPAGSRRRRTAAAPRPAERLPAPPPRPRPPLPHWTVQTPRRTARTLVTASASGRPAPAARRQAHSPFSSPPAVARRRRAGRHKARPARGEKNNNAAATPLPGKRREGQGRGKQKSN